jgi:hypothetical protein
LNVARAFRVLVAFAVALPLGRGGICCCLLGDDLPAAIAKARPVEPARSCCSQPAPVDSTPAPHVPERDDCDCPQRDNAVLTTAPSDPAVVAGLPGLDLGPIHHPGAPLHAIDASRVLFGGDSPSPVPKLPRYRTLCVLLC